MGVPSSWGYSVILWIPFHLSDVFTLQNSPNDLQMLSDAPAHHLFCLLPPVPPTQNSLPEVLAVVQVREQLQCLFWPWYSGAAEGILCVPMVLCLSWQVCMEGEISRQSIMNSLSRGKKASGDLIPWTISEQVGDGAVHCVFLVPRVPSCVPSVGFLSPVQFQDPDFGGLSGGRVIRIAVHPDYQGVNQGLGPVWWCCHGNASLGRAQEQGKHCFLAVFNTSSSGHQSSAPLVPRQHGSIPSCCTQSKFRDIFCGITKCLAFSDCQGSLHGLELPGLMLISDTLVLYCPSPWSCHVAKQSIFAVPERCLPCWLLMGFKGRTLLPRIKNQRPRSAYSVLVLPLHRWAMAAELWLCCRCTTKVNSHVWKKKQFRSQKKSQLWAVRCGNFLNFLSC